MENMFIEPDDHDYLNSLYEEFVCDILGQGKKLIFSAYQMDGGSSQIATKFALSIIRKKLLRCNCLFAVMAEQKNLVFVPLLSNEAIYGLEVAHVERYEIDPD